ncbi:GntP family permease [Brachybacterium sp. GCM10030267]|uniref:GntP family permease n=1 Tax=unclassified Brachybacterium TaxID=2623841 RepID=UPI00360A0303
MDTIILVHLVIAVVGIIVLIAKAKINPVVSLIVGALYLGIAGGLGFSETVAAVNTGFGNLMAEIGLIIGFGVFIGTILTANGTMVRVVDALLSVVGPRGSKYVLGLSSGIIFPSIYFDVALVILAPIADTIAKRTGKSVAPLAGALAIGLQVGLHMVVPGAVALAMASSLSLDVGMVIALGVPYGIFLICTSVALHSTIMTYTWNPARDMESFAEAHVGAESAGVGAVHPASGSRSESGLADDASREPQTKNGSGAISVDTPGGDDSTVHEDSGATDASSSHHVEHRYPLVMALLPVIIPLVLIITRTIAVATGMEDNAVTFLGEPVVALMIGLLVGIVMVWPQMGRHEVDGILTRGAQISGSILLFNGVAGSLGLIISEVGVGDMLSSLFSANASLPILLTWIIAALFRLAQGSGSVSAITAAALVGPIVASMGAPLILVLFAAGTGAGLGGHVTDNTFWIFKQMLSLTTRGALQVYTLAQSTMSVIGLVSCLVLDLIF